MRSYSRQLCYQMQSVQGRSKFPTDSAWIPQGRELVTGTCFDAPLDNALL